MTRLTPSDIETIRFLRTRGQHAVDIGRIFSISKMDALLDVVLEHVRPESAAPANTTALAVGFLALDVVGGELRQDRDLLQVDHIKAPAQARDHGVLASLIRELLAAGRTPPVIVSLLGCSPNTIHNIRARDEERRARTKSAPSGAPAADDQPQNAGPAAATCEATEQPHQGSDEVSPLRKAEELELALQPPVNVLGQSDRSTSSTAQRRVAGVDLSALAAEAIRSGAVQIKRCPTAVAVETQGARINPADAAAMRQRHDAMRDSSFSWRGR